MKPVIALLLLALSFGVAQIAHSAPPTAPTDPAGQYDLARAYQTGKGMPRDVKQAAYWYRKSAEGGYAPAQLAYGLYGLTRVEGVPLNRVEAMQWLRKAADQGLAQAQDHVAWGYYRGFGVAPDQVEACKWATLAAQGKSKFGKTLDFIRSNLNAMQIADCEMRAASWSPSSN